MSSKKPIMHETAPAQPVRAFLHLWTFSGRKHPFLWIGFVALLLLVLGAVMWQDNGSAIFTALVSAALAWCF